MSDEVDTLNSTRKENLPLEAADAPAAPAKAGRQERRQLLLQQLAQFGSVDEFKVYCNENSIPFAQREQLIRDIYHCCGNEDYYDQLLTYAEQLKTLSQRREALFPQPQEAATAVPSSDIRSAPLGSASQEPLVGTSQGFFYASPEAPVRPFWHSSEGNKISDREWHDVVAGLNLLGFIDKEQIPDMELLLGVSHKEDVLTRPILFHGYKGQAALLFGLLYGTHAYELSQPLQVDSALLRRLDRPPSLRFEAGLYRCPQLIMVPQGRGLNADGSTRDNYWGIVARALRFPRASKPSADPAHSFVNALNTSRPLDPLRALPILLLLKPLGRGGR